MAEYINIMLNCPKFCCDRGINYCFDCDDFKGLNDTKDEVACDWREKNKINKEKKKN